MKTIGLIGGMSWESTVTYYQLINRAVRERLGGLHSAKIVLWSVEFDEIERCQSSGDWAKAARILADCAKGLEAAGVDMVLICTNTMHKVADETAAAVSVPLLHIAEATGRALGRDGVKRVALLGTKYTLTDPFYKDRLATQGFEVMIPSAADVEMVNRVIFEELCVGVVKPESKAAFLRVIEDLRKQGAEAVILGCTEIGMLVSQADTDLPVYDTTVIHAEEAVRAALDD